MLSIYCKGHKYGKAPCAECSELTEYACSRLESCRFGYDKTFCSKCTVHCYEPDMRRRIKEVMKVFRAKNPLLLSSDSSETFIAK